MLARRGEGSAEIGLGLGCESRGAEETPRGRGRVDEGLGGGRSWMYVTTDRKMASQVMVVVNMDVKHMTKEKCRNRRHYWSNWQSTITSCQC